MRKLKMKHTENTQNKNLLYKHEANT